MKYQGAFISPNDEPELLDIVALVIPPYRIRLNTYKAFMAFQFTISH